MNAQDAVKSLTAYYREGSLEMQQRDLASWKDAYYREGSLEI